MKLRKLYLTNFRNYENAEFEFSPEVNIIVGPNGVGKTNIIEAIAMLSLGKSYRGGLEYEVIRFDQGYAKIKGEYQKDRLEINIVKNEDNNRVKKSFKINNVIKTGVHFIGFTKVITFGPEDIRLVAGSPSRRREHLDKMLRQIHPQYNQNLNKYNRILKQRNKLLDKLKGQVIHNTHEVQISVWNDQLLQTGIFIQEMRKTFFKYAEDHLEEISDSLYKNGYRLRLNYKQNHLTKERLKRYHSVDVRNGTTSIGPHRDDYEFILIDDSGEKELKGFGSRGQQRTGVLCVKILELKFFEEKSEHKPILLLDDIFSELDKEYRAQIEQIINSQQTIITTADSDMIPDHIKSQSKIITLT